ncbi:MAG: hypothetical protein PSX36_13060 [bacterium]|nr:hypothetical protein [bacterium]
MNTNNISPNLDLLDRIKQVDAPAFLFTRIRSKIESTNNIRFSAPWVVAGSFVLLVVVLLNVTIVFGNNKTDVKNNNLSQSLNLMSDNTLYK